MSDQFITLIISANLDDVCVVKAYADLSDFSSNDVGEIVAYALAKSDKTLKDFAGNDEIQQELASRLPEGFFAKLETVPDNTKIDPSQIGLIIISQCNDQS